MKKSNISGWKDVFSFTLVQTLKNRAFLISFLILLLLASVSMPIISRLTTGGQKDDGQANPIKKVYVNNETALPDLNFSGITQEKALNHIIFEALQEDYDTVADRIQSTEKESVILTVSESAGSYSLKFVKASKGPVKNNSLQNLGNAAAKEFENIKLTTLGITEEQDNMLHAKVATTVTMADANGKPIIKEDTTISGSEYWFIYGILFTLLMVNMMASTQIATSIVTEKSTRVVEYLLITVKPLAIMVGKIIAMLTAVLFQMITMILVLFASNQITAMLSSGSHKSIMEQYLPDHIFQNINIVHLALCLILIVLGMIFYATLAGLAGATVSRLEEISEGLTLFTFTNLIGVYVGLAAANVLMGAGNNGFVTFALLFPLSSPFVLPGAILIGKASVLIALAAIVLQIIFNMLLFKFVSKVYETLILHSGNTIKLKELIKISKTA
jgi:ABC-2 type transport system permease protein